MATFNDSADENEYDGLSEMFFEENLSSDVTCEDLKVNKCTDGKPSNSSDLKKSEDVERYVGRSKHSNNRTSWSGARLLRDLQEIENDEEMMIQVESADSIYNWNVSFLAPNGKLIKAEIHFGDDYPCTPPKMFVKQKLLHPNISAANGRVCLDDLENVWTAGHSAWSLILSVKCLLSDPNPRNPLNAHAAKILMENPEMYHKLAEQYFEMLDCFDEENGDDQIFDQNYTVDGVAEEMLVQRTLHMQLFSN